MTQPTMRYRAVLTSLAAALLWGLPATAPSAAGADLVVLDKQRMLDRQTWWDNRDWDWYKQNIPFLETPDGEIDTTYDYRWEVVT